MIEKLARFRCRLEWIIGAEHHALVAERRDRAVERLGRAHAGCRDDDIFFDVIRRLLGKLYAIKLGAAIETPQQERQRLAEVTEHDFGAGEAVEQAAEDKAQSVRSRLETPFPGGAAQAIDAFKGRRGR